MIIIKKDFKILICILCIALIFTSCQSKKINKGKSVKKNVSAVASYNTVKVKRDIVSRIIKSDGTFISNNDVYLNFYNGGGYVKKIYVKTLDKVKKGQLLCELDTDSIESDLKSAKSNLEIAKLNYEEAVSKNAPQKMLYELQFQVTKYECKVKKLQSKLDGAKMTSPCDGEIKFAKVMSIGDEVSEYDNIFVIMEKGSMLIKFTQEKAKDFKLGEKVTFTIGDAKYEGRVVTSIDEFVNDEKKPIIYVKPTSIPDDAKVGDSVYGEVYLYDKKNVLCLPKDAIRNSSNHPYVEVMKDGIKSERYITIGLEGDKTVEILEGLNQGEEVITN